MSWNSRYILEFLLFCPKNWKKSQISIACNFTNINKKVSFFNLFKKFFDFSRLSEVIISNIIIIKITLGNAPYKMLHKLKSACPSEKQQLWTSASSSVSQKSRDQLSDPSIQQATGTSNRLTAKFSNPNPSCR